jgi:hypothetical protein
MMTKRIRLSLLTALWLACGSCALVPRLYRSPRPDPEVASVAAVLFAKRALVDLSQPDAYSRLSEGMRREFNFEQYIELLSRQHPKGFPSELSAAEYETTSDPKALFIWLTGEAGGEHFYYRLRVEGTDATGYNVAEVWRVARLPATPPRRQLSTRRSTDDLR